MKTTIKSKIIISFCLLILLLLAGQVIFNLFFSKESLIQQTKTEIQSLYNSILNSYSDDEENLYQLTSYGDSINGFSIQIFSEETLIYSSRNPLPFLSETFSSRPQKDSDFNTSLYQENPSTTSAESITGDGSSIITIFGKFMYEGEYRYVNISKPVESIQDVVNVLTFSSIIISLVILLIGMVVVFIIAKSISKPINDIKSISERVANLDFNTKADENSSSLELSSLAKSINSMSTQLRNSMRDLQNANEKLQEDIEYQKTIDKNRKQFIANISHEMKTPLALLQIYCENLNEDIEGIDKKEYCQIILGETLRMDSIVKDMLNISSIENDFAKSNKNDYDISHSCQSIITYMKPILSNINLIIDIDENIVIYGDKKQLDEAMRNYLNNAVAHVKSTIKISLKKIENDLVFSVYNDGINIPESELSNIWDSFYKADKSRKRSGSSNAGLGLYIVKIILEKHSGKYAVQNKTDGVEFTFTIPI
ncbi:MAG: HAMP domain-containing sensor histidine kinase [Clostridia bacterium]